MTTRSHAFRFGDQLSEPRELERGRVHLWYILTEHATRMGWLSRYGGILSREERERQRRFVFQKDRDEFLIARVMLRTALSQYSKTRPADWCFQLNQYGKPEIMPDQNQSQIRFNLTHCHGLVLCGVTIVDDIGVDCESLERPIDFQKLVDRVFSARERQYFHSVPSMRQQELFFRLWTLKESYIKARGLGMSIPLQEFSFDVSNPKAIRIEFSPNLQDQSDRWQFRTPAIPEPFVAAVAVNFSESRKLRVDVRQSNGGLGTA